MKTKARKNEDTFQPLWQSNSWNFDNASNDADKDKSKDSTATAGENDWWGKVGSPFNWSFGSSSETTQDWFKGQSNFADTNNNFFAFESNDAEPEPEEPSEPASIVLAGEAAPTGEDTDVTYFHCDVKVYRFDVEKEDSDEKTWKNQGEGELYVNYVKDSKIGRLLCRQKGTGLLRLNCPITASFSHKIIHQDRIQFAVPTQIPTKNDTTEGQDQDSAAITEENTTQLITYCVKPCNPQDVTLIIDAITKIQTNKNEVTPGSTDKTSPSKSL